MRLLGGRCSSMHRALVDFQKLDFCWWGISEAEKAVLTITQIEKTCKSNNWMNHIHDFPIERQRSCMLGLLDLKGCWTLELVANLEALSLCKEAHVAKQHGWSALRSLWARCIHSVTLWIHLKFGYPFGYPSDSVLDLSHSRWCLRRSWESFSFVMMPWFLYNNRVRAQVHVSAAAHCIKTCMLPYSPKTRRTDFVVSSWSSCVSMILHDSFIYIIYVYT